jgi:hypothetical protein
MKLVSLEDNENSNVVHVQFPGKKDVKKRERAEFESVAPPSLVWNEVHQIRDVLSSVPSFDYAFLPESIRDWVKDIAERMQCPPEFVAITAMTALGSVLGKKIAIGPQRYTNWVEVVNFWAILIGRPGVLKSPAMNEALAMLRRLEKQARERNAEALKKFKRELKRYQIQQSAHEQMLKKKIKENEDIPEDEWDKAIDDAPTPPPAQRYIVNDATYEATGVVLALNPGENSVVVFRDEIISLLKIMDQENYISMRGFFLSAWNGKGEYEFERIGRGTLRVGNLCLSLLGSTQPVHASDYMSKTKSDDDPKANDGLIQRFNMLVWPDTSPEWKNVDRYPDGEARHKAWSAFEHLDRLDPKDVGAKKDEFDDFPILRFSNDAQIMFDAWREQLEIEARSGELATQIEAHISKYRKLVPTLALLNHLADGKTGPVDQDSLERAIAFSVFLRAHAERAYNATGSDVRSANAIMERVWYGDLKDGFTEAQLTRNAWAHLSDPRKAARALKLLIENGWLAKDYGGKTKKAMRYYVNPLVFGM